MNNRTASEYFHPRKFKGNNIEYRIGSSAAIGRFKENQAFLLNQLAMNPYHDFSQTAKEILLFKFDVWFDFICELEQFFLIKGTSATYEEIKNLGDERRDYVYNTLRSVENIDDDYLEVYITAITAIKHYLEETVREIVETDLSPSSKFGAIVDLAGNVLNHILYVVQELDVVFYTDKTPILNLDAMSCELQVPKSDNVICSAEIRVLEYMKYRKFDEIIVKNYLNKDLVVDHSPLKTFLGAVNLKYKVI